MATRARKAELKLFVWTKFCPDYTDGLAFAIAENETQARNLIKETLVFEPGPWGPLSIYPLTKRIAFCVPGGD